MTAVRRALVLAAVVLLAAVAVRDATGWHEPGHGTSPQPVESFAALAGVAGPSSYGRHTACGIVLGPNTLGVIHPTLPCGARIFVAYRGTRVLTDVVDRGPYEPGRAFDVTDALARTLDLDGVQQVRWSYARLG